MDKEEINIKITNGKSTLKYYFKNTIEYFGPKLYSIEPISQEYKGLFDMSKFTDKDIDKLIDENIKGKNAEELEDELHNLCGGIAILKDEKIVLTPNCCGDLSNIYGWEDIKNNNSKNWTKLWIGHPWVFYRKLEDLIEISEYFDDDNPLIKFENIRFSLTEKQLETQLNQVREVQEIFQKRLSNRLKARNIKNYEGVAERMGCCYR